MHILPKYCVWFSDLLTYFPSTPLISPLMIFLCSWSDSWTHHARLRGCDCVFLVCSLATILFTKTGVTVLHVQFNYKCGRLFQAWHFKSEACHHSWSSCLWERAHGLILDSVYNREGTWHRDPVHLEIESAFLFFFLHCNKERRSFVFQVKYFMSVSRGNYKLSLNRSRSCCCCATFAQEVWVFLCHYSCITLTGAISLCLAFWLETWDGSQEEEHFLTIKNQTGDTSCIRRHIWLRGAFHSCFVPGKASATDMRNLNHLPVPPQNVWPLLPAPPASAVSLSFVLLLRPLLSRSQNLSLINDNDILVMLSFVLDFSSVWTFF